MSCIHMHTHTHMWMRVYHEYSFMYMYMPCHAVPIITPDTYRNHIAAWMRWMDGQTDRYQR